MSAGSAPSSSQVLFPARSSVWGSRRAVESASESPPALISSAESHASLKRAERIVAVAEKSRRRIPRPATLSAAFQTIRPRTNPERPPGFTTANARAEHSGRGRTARSIEPTRFTSVRSTPRSAADHSRCRIARRTHDTRRSAGRNRRSGIERLPLTLPGPLLRRKLFSTKNAASPRSAHSPATVSKSAGDHRESREPLDEMTGRPQPVRPPSIECR